MAEYHEYQPSTEKRPRFSQEQQSMGESQYVNDRSGGPSDYNQEPSTLKKKKKMIREFNNQSSPEADYGEEEEGEEMDSPEMDYGEEQEEDDEYG